MSHPIGPRPPRAAAARRSDHARRLVATLCLLAGVTPAGATPATTTLRLGATMAFERMDGDAVVGLTPRLGLEHGPLTLALAPSLRMIAMSTRRDYGLRDVDWDERAEWLRPLERLVVAAEDGSAALRVAGLDGLSLGRGTLIDGYRAALLQDHYRAAGHAVGRLGPLEGELFVDDVTALQVVASRLGVRPLADRDDDAVVGLRSLTLAFEGVADRTAPRRHALASAALGPGGRLRTVDAPWVGALAELSALLHRSGELSVGLWASFGVAHQDQPADAPRDGRGAEVGVGVDLRAPSDGRSLLRLQLAPSWGAGIWLPGRIDAAYALERVEVATAGGAAVPLGERMASIAADGGVGFAGRAQLRAEPIAGWVVAADVRAAPQASEDVSAWSLRTSLALDRVHGQIGWMRRPGRLHLLAGGVGFRVSGPWSLGLRLERAMHADPRASGRMAPRWDGGGWLAFDLP